MSDARIRFIAFAVIMLLVALEKKSWVWMLIAIAVIAIIVKNRN